MHSAYKEMYQKKMMKIVFRYLLRGFSSDFSQVIPSLHNRFIYKSSARQILQH